MTLAAVAVEMVETAAPAVTLRLEAIMVVAVTAVETAPGTAVETLVETAAGIAVQTEETMAPVSLPTELAKSKPQS